jgi:3-phosphoshikimate 1-carboxyvinyltransferase
MIGLNYIKIDSNNVEIILPTSKSISNRALVLNALLNNKVNLFNLSLSDDTQLMNSVLTTKCIEVNLQNAGTCMRFLTAYFACQPNQKINLLCSERMQQRPIKVLVDALKNLGANINYLTSENFPPLNISGTHLTGKSININGSESSQFITAIMLIAPFVKNGISIHLKGEIASFDYIKMTSLLMNQFGFDVKLLDNLIEVNEYKNEPFILNYNIEKDWSGAAFWYLIAVLNPQLSIHLKGLSKTSIQGDVITIDIFEKLGISTYETKNGLSIIKDKNASDFLVFDLINAIDLAPALCVACAALNLNTTIFGLQNLKIKESNRLLAIVIELSKFGFNVSNSNDTITIKQSKQIDYSQSVTINTYNDHRIAMAFAPLVILFHQLKIDEIDVVSKSYPNFFNDLKLIGISLNLNC